MNAILQLEDYRLTRLVIEANTDVVREEGKNSEVNILVDFDVLKAKDEPRFLVPMIFKMKPGKNKKYCSFKKIEVEIDGYFRLSPEATEEEERNLIPYNCLAIIYGLMRGIIANNTGKLPGGVIILPTMNFLNVIRAKIEENKAEINNKQKDEKME